MLAPLSLLTLLTAVLCDVYLNNPRGSNNKLSEQSNNVQNQNRLFDSQNNAAGGYQIGDDCKPVCQNGNRNYDESKEGAMKGTMKYYQGSELYVEWLSQHACGAGSPNTRCQVILQYMCENDNPQIRDGTKRGNQNIAGGQQEPPTEAGAADLTRGQHEPLDFYLACKSRERNKGLYTADQNVRNDRGATATRQNPNGNANAGQRHGLECPEERDYYPYWHPTPWHDIAVLTHESQDRCSYYQTESQNQKAKGSCSEAEFNNARSCAEGGGTWSESGAFDEPEPECVGGMTSRDNHLGNVRNGQPMYYLWKIPDYVEGRCVLRIRYNITTADLAADAQASTSGVLSEDEEEEAEEEERDPFFVDASFNDPNPGQRRRSRFQAGGSPILSQDPKGDFLNLGLKTRVLQLQVNTNQLARTFEDRTHSFLVQRRPGDVPESARIVNYNVRGRRGNIVQVYPSVEYDFVPAEITVEAGTYFHFQWVGSDANPQGNAGNGRQGTDRSNLVQVASRGETVPLPVERHSLLFNAEDEASLSEGRELVDRFAYLNQDAQVDCDPDENNDQAVTNCKQLNGASAYFDGGLVKLTQVGEHHIASTRNNDFSNRSQKATIKVTTSFWEWYSILAMMVGSVGGVAALLYFAAALYAFKRPASWLFSKRCRPRILRWLVSKEALQEKEQERKRLKHTAETSSDAIPVERPMEGSLAKTPEKSRSSPLQRCLRCFRFFGVQEQRLPVLSLLVLSVLVFAIGFLSHLQGGFEQSLAFSCAKGGGYILDLNFALLILPTLKSLQTALRGAGTTREWLPIDDPISFHITIAIFISFGVVVHVGGHIVHMLQISQAPWIQSDPLSLWVLSEQEKISGTPVWLQIFDYKSRFAPLSGIVIFMIMTMLYITALPCVRRGTNTCSRRFGGFKLFAKMHNCWKWIYVLLLLHAPARLWIWFFFPCLFILVDRVMEAQQQHPYVTLKNVKKLPRDVMSLTFEIPKGFTYQAGQYILLGWQGEWHPFTLTSAPEERRLSVHIRAPSSYDWCSALRKRLLEEAPAARASGIPETPLISVDYEKSLCPHSHTPYSRPCIGGNGASAAVAAIRGIASPTDVAVHVDVPEEKSKDSSLPDDAVVLQLSGPFGAPAQKVWQFETLMVVGAGIGVTPFASMLRSVQLRTKQREAILRGAAASWSRCADKEAAVDQLLEDVVTVPKKIHFYWIVRSQEEFDWFSDLLSAAASGPAQDIVRINVFMTGEVELAQVKQLPCVHSQFFGRPNWSRIFKQNKEQHKGEHIGVFLCGSPAIGVELARESLSQSDSPHLAASTRFSFFKETF